MQEKGTAEKKTMSRGKKIGIGCSCGCLGIVLLIVAGVFGAAIWLNGYVAKNEAELKEYGFDKTLEGVSITVTDPIDEPILYKSQMVSLQSNSSTNVAVIAQICDVSGQIDGTFFFRGQMLEIKPGARINGDLNVKAQMILVHGEIAGEIMGSYDQLIKDSSSAAE